MSFKLICGLFLSCALSFAQLSATASDASPGKLHVFWTPPLSGTVSRYTIEVRTPSGGTEYRQVIPSRRASAAAVLADSDYTVNIYAVMSDGTQQKTSFSGHSMPYFQPQPELLKPPGFFMSRQSASDGTRRAFLSFHNVPNVAQAVAYDLTIVEGDNTVETVSLPITVSTGDYNNTRLALAGADLYVVTGRSQVVCYRFLLSGTPLTAALVSSQILSTDSASVGITHLASGSVIAWSVGQSTTDSLGQTWEHLQFYTKPSGSNAWNRTDSTTPNPGSPTLCSFVLLQAPDGTIWALWNHWSSREIFRLRLSEGSGTLFQLDFKHIVTYLTDGAFTTQPDESWLTAVPWGNQVAIAYQRFDVIELAGTSPIYSMEALESNGVWIEHEAAAYVGMLLVGSGDTRTFVDFPVRNRWIADRLELSVRGDQLSLTYRPLDTEDNTFQELYSVNYIGGGAWSEPVHLGTLGALQWNQWLAEGGIVAFGCPSGGSILVAIPGGTAPTPTPPPPPPPPPPLPNTAPSISIVSPANDAAIPCGAIQFIATAHDSEDGDLTSKIRWSNGSSGASTSISYGCGGPNLGTKTVTAAVVDSGGLTATASVTFTVKKK